MPHNSKEPGTERENQQSMEGPTGLLLWSTQGKVRVCMVQPFLLFVVLHLQKMR